MRWEVVGQQRDEQDDGIEWVWVLKRGSETRHVRVLDARKGHGSELIESLLDSDAPPEILTFPISLVTGDVVEYVGVPMAGEEVTGDLRAELPRPGDRGTIVDINEYNGDVIVEWESCGALVHGRADLDLLQIR
jgi:hypothetical protein